MQAAVAPSPRLAAPSKAGRVRGGLAQGPAWQPECCHFLRRTFQLGVDIRSSKEATAESGLASRHPVTPGPTHPAGPPATSTQHYSSWMTEMGGDRTPARGPGIRARAAHSGLWLNVEITLCLVVGAVLANHAQPIVKPGNILKNRFQQV